MFFLGIVRFSHGLESRRRFTIRFRALEEDGDKLSEGPFGQKQNRPGQKFLSRVFVSDPEKAAEPFLDVLERFLT